MSLGGLLRSELHKALTQPATWIGSATSVLACGTLTVFLASTARTTMASGSTEYSSSPLTLAAESLPLGTIGAVIVGVTLVSSEYSAASEGLGGSRQITTTLTTTPARPRVLAAKALVLAFVVAVTALLTLAVAAPLASLVLGRVSDGVDVLGAGAVSGRAWLYWTCLGLDALAFTVLTRSGLVPLAVMILGSSAVSVSFLLTFLTPWAFWLPDLAGAGLLGAVEGAPDLLPGSLVMAGWTALFLVGAGWFLRWRDA